MCSPPAKTLQAGASGGDTVAKTRNLARRLLQSGAVNTGRVAIMGAMQQDTEERFKTGLQVIGILGLLGIVSMLFHKGFVDISVLWQQHSGADFLAALARYFFKNLAG